MKYFILWAGAMYPGERTRRLEGGDWGGLRAGSFIEGRPISSPIALPIEVELVADDRGDAQMPSIFVVPALVLHKDVANLLSEAGVENIQYFSASLVDPNTAAQFSDYLLGNVLGVVDAIDMEKSEAAEDSPPGIAMQFETMIIDPAKCKGQLLFRLMHRQNLIVIAESVADKLRGSKLPFIHMVEPEDFA